MNAVWSAIASHLGDLVTTVAATALVGLVTYLYRAGSWTKTHRRARLFEERGDKFVEGEVWDSAFEQYKLALQIWEEEVNHGRMLALYHKLGKAYSRSGDAERALQAFIHCEALWEAIRKEIKIHEVYFELSQAYLSKRDLVKAATYIDKAIQLLRGQQSPRLPVALAMAARIAKERGRVEEAESEYTEAVRVLDGNGDTLGLASVYYELGNLKVFTKQLDLASAYYTKSAAAYDKLGSGRAEEIRAKVHALVDPMGGVAAH